MTRPPPQAPRRWLPRAASSPAGSSPGGTGSSRSSARAVWGPSTAPSRPTGQASGRAQADQERHGLPRRPGPVRRRTPGAGADGSPQYRQGPRRRQPPTASRSSYGAGQWPADHRILRRPSDVGQGSAWSCSWPVCQAVQHAHQKGIIHRDLKPSNVLVTRIDGRPTPKVIDFGVAKATDGSSPTLADGHRGDRGHACVHVARSRPDPPSRTSTPGRNLRPGRDPLRAPGGSPPIERSVQKAAILEMMRMVREVDPPSPSTRLCTAEALPASRRSAADRAGEVKRRCAGTGLDRDEGLEKDRRRYETANGSRADIMRHLASEPVLAAAAEPAIGCGSSCKHRGAVIAASLVLWPAGRDRRHDLGLFEADGDSRGGETRRRKGPRGARTSRKAKPSGWT